MGDARGPVARSGAVAAPEEGNGAAGLAQKAIDCSHPGYPMTAPEVSAEFDPKLKVYLVLQVAAILCATMVGILVLPIWAFVGPVWANAYFPTIQATLTDRALLYTHGIWFRQEMSIPLDKIQDVSLHHGPILDTFGLSTLRVETAGGGPAGSAAVLTGVVGAAAFRSAIITRRDSITAAPRGEAAEGDDALLRDIRDSLVRIEGLLAVRRGVPPEGEV